MRTLRVSLVAVALLAVASGAMAYDELWVAGKVDQVADTVYGTKEYHPSGEWGVARYDSADGSFLGWWMHPDPGTGVIETPVTGASNKPIYMSMGPDDNVYVVAGSMGHIHQRIIYRYAQDGTPAGSAANLADEDATNDAIFANDTGFFGGSSDQLRMVNFPVAFSDTHVYTYADQYKYQSTDNGQYLFRYNLDGTYAGTMGDGSARISVELTHDSWGVQHAQAVDTAGNYYHALDQNIYRVAADGTGDPNTPWMTVPDVYGSKTDVKGMAFDDAGRMYVAVNDGANAAYGEMYRYNVSDQSAAGPPDDPTNHIWAKDGDTYDVDGDPHRAGQYGGFNYVTIGPDGRIYGANGLEHQ